MARSSIGGTIEHFTVDDVSWTPVTLSCGCRKVTFGEDPLVAGWPTTAYKIRRPDSTAGDPRGMPHGTIYQEDGFFMPGTVLAFLQTVSGSTTFFLDQQAGRRV